MTVEADGAVAELTQSEVEEFLFLEARLADESDYDGWEALWTDDAIYWVPAGRADADPQAQVSVIFDNRSRIATRLNQLRTGKRYAQSPASNLRRLISNLEVLGRAGNGDTEVGANFLLLESRARGLQLWGAGPPTGCGGSREACGWPTRRWSWSTWTNHCPRWVF